MIEGFTRRELAVKDCFTYTATRDCSPSEHPEVIQYFDVTQNETDPAMQQVNVTRSKKNVIRGIHISAFPKVVFCPLGRIYDVVVDMRPDSPTFKRWCGAWLDRDTHIICPAFCAHGVFSAEEDSAICYYQGGTFWPHLDYAISGLDPALAVEWPRPIDADDFVMSEKDLTSAPADDALWAKIKARMDDPIADIHTTTNSDIVVIATSVSDAVPLIERLQGTRVHFLQQSAVNRESLSAAIFSLRPKDGIIYIAAGPKSDIVVELLNVVQVCDAFRHQLVIVTGDDYDEIELIRPLIQKEAPTQVAVLVGQAMLYRGMTKTEAAARLTAGKGAIERRGTFTQFDQLAGVAIQYLREKKGGFFRLVNPGVLDGEAVKEFCAANGVNFDGQVGGEAADIAGEAEPAQQAFKALVDTFKD
jgi:dTDP-4-dehydrorhamnose 3,5-epimerase